ncbi:MAG: hypothetical protein ABSF76_07060, partial [Opitutaceae bacterium]
WRRGQASRRWGSIQGNDPAVGGFAEASAGPAVPYGRNHPLPFMASIWRMSFFWFPPLIIRIIFCICCG